MKYWAISISVFLRPYLLLQLLVACATLNAVDARIAVSDLIPDEVLETVRTLAEANSLEISTISVGSLPAMDALRLDEISLAIIALPDGKELSDDIFETFPFAYSTAIIAVSKTNPINEVSFDDLRGIFGSDPDLHVETWGELKVQSLADRLIKPLIAQDEAGISTELFRHVVLGGGAMKLTVNEVINSEIKGILVKNVSSVAVLPHLPDTGTIKALMISENSGSPAFGPTNNNIYYKDYPIRLPFQIVYKKECEAELAKTLYVLLSEELTKVLRANHFFVPPDIIRNSFINGLNLIDEI